MPFVSFLVTEDITPLPGCSQGHGEGVSGPLASLLEVCFGRREVGLWAELAGRGGSGAVELLRSLERQIESLTVSKNNQARVKLPGVSASGRT